MFKKIAAFVLTFVLVSAFLALSGCKSSGQTALEEGPKSFSSASEVKSVIEKFRSATYSNEYKNAAVEDMAAMPESNTAESSSDSYSRTNTQVEGVDEGDTVKVDGNYIYKLQSDGLVIVSANNGELEQTAKISIKNYVPQELYIKDNKGDSDKLILIGGVYKYLNYSGARGVEPLMECCRFSYSSTDIRVYDISDRENPVLERQITVSGNYYTSRLIDNEFYYMTNYWFYYNDEANYIPKISDSTIESGAEKDIPFENIYYYESVPSYSYLIMGSIGLGSPETESDLKAYLGLYGEIYVSSENIYVASADYSGCYVKSLFGYYETARNAYAKTRIVKLALSDLKQKAITRVDGTVKDRYSLDEHNGCLRVATTVNKWNTAADGVSVKEESSSSDTANTPQVVVNSNIYSNVFVLDANLATVGKIENIAPGETVYSVRFKGETGTIVTFRQIDPYFILDLSDPANPKISNGLKEEGVSHYIHYLGSSGLTIGVGRDTKNIQNEWGSWVTWAGIKVSLYDNTGAEAVNLQTYILGNAGTYTYAYSEIFYNPKALLYDEALGLFAFPVQIWNYGNTSGSYRYETMTQGLAVFKFDTVNKKLEYRGIISNFEENISLNDWTGYYINYWSFISRGARIGDYIYTISERYITSYDIETLAKKKALEVLDKDCYIYGIYY